MPVHAGHAGSAEPADDFTTLLQVAFPPLPDDMSTVDVQLATVPPFRQVPVTPAGMLPLASYPTDLIAPAGGTSVLASTRHSATAQLGSSTSS